MVLSELSRLAEDIIVKSDKIKVTFWDKLQAWFDTPFLGAEMLGKSYNDNLYRIKIKDFRGYYKGVKDIEIEIIPEYSLNHKEPPSFKVLFSYNGLKYCRKLGEKQRTINGFKKLLIKLAEIVIDFRDELQEKEANDFALIKGDTSVIVVNGTYCL